MSCLRPVLALSVLLAPMLAIAECTPIDVLPARITEPGCHRLVVSDALALKDGAAIEILRDDVVLDLGGHTISNRLGPSTTAAGVRAYRRSNVVVRNGVLRGFATGVELGGTAPDASFGSYTVEHMQLHESRLFGLDLRGFAITARDNRIMRTGGTTMPQRAGQAMGIYVQGTLATLVDNEVLGVAGDPFETYGIRVAGGNAAVVERNRVLSAGHGVVIHDGASGICRDNTVGEIAVLSYQCPIDAGGNGGELRSP